MKAIVLGAGVIGVTTAYELARDGHQVTVVEQREAVALETSFANGGQLSWDHGEPLPHPGIPLQALKWLGRKNAPLLYRLRLDPALWAWTLSFLTNCREPQYWRNAERMLRVALYARERMEVIQKEEQVAFDHNSHGIVTLYQDTRAFDRAMDAIGAWRELGGSRTSLDRKGCIEIEPTLAHSTFLIAGGIHTPHDQSGDCHAFTERLAERCVELGVEFQFNTRVKRLTKEGYKITSAVTDRGEVKGDVFVLALGSYSPQMMSGLGMRLPVYPAKGYSVTIPVADDTLAPKTSITSHDHKLVFSRLGATLRVAGMMEFSGHDTELDERRARLVLDNALRLFPGAGNRDEATFWTGLRPQTPDSVPVIGRARQENLILNTGHGMLGWTMAAGSARIAADLAAGHAPHIDMEGLGWERFA
ncbi:D-amino acid dehydrogenase [Pseudomonadota bacterium]